MLVKTYASAVCGVDAITITVEVNAGGALPPQGVAPFSLVGLPDNAVREGWRRVTTAVKNSGFRIPRLKLIVNLAPADIRKEGSAYDLPTAIGILGATDQINAERLDRFLLMGELSLDGSLRPIKGALSIAIQARKEGFDGIILPKQNGREAAIVDSLDVYGMESLREVIDFFNEKKEFIPMVLDTRKEFADQSDKYCQNFSDVKGQEHVKRALEIAAAGGHNAILIGPPGAGKTMMAQRLPTILPPLTLHEALDTTKIHSVAGMLDADSGLIPSRPFRSPHHSISNVALVGGGSNPMPGEISKAHNGVLFLDELPEFKRSVLEVLRQPMEQRKVTISRARITVDFQASFLLLAAMNPCHCGFYGHPEKDCLCGPGTVQRYLNKVSGPLLDRIDLHIEVTPVSYYKLADFPRPGESSEVIAKRVVKARAIQEKRFKGMHDIHCNAHMPTRMVQDICVLSKPGRALLKQAMEKLKLSARAYDRILKVARTAADLEGERDINEIHLAEAIQYRSLDREGWAG